MSNKPQSNQLHAEIVTAYFCGNLASEITRTYSPRYSAQEAQVCGLMQNLGRMMMTYYRYEDIERSHALQIEKNLAENDAIEQTLGMSFEQIGAAIAKQWCLPDVLQNSMSMDAGKAPPRVAANAMAWQQLCSSFSRRITDIEFRLPENRAKIEIAKEVEFFRLALHLKESEVREIIDKCLLDTDEVLGGMSFPCDVEHARTLLRKASERVLDVLSAEDRLTKDSNSIDGKTPVEIIQLSLRFIHDKYNFDHTLLLLPDSSSGLIAIAGVGKNAGQVTAKFRCYGPKPDLFRAIMARKTDIFVADVCQPAYAKLVPEWYPTLLGAKSLLMLPLIENTKLLGMIYADYCELHSNAPDNLEQGDMLEWRNQLIHALQSGATKST